MNQYGSRAQQHWKEFLPKRYGELQDPETFFAHLGEEIQEQVMKLSQALAGEDPPGETYMEKLGRLNMAHLNAESRVLSELALLPAEDDEGG
jgi:hypothetical protein